MALFMPLVRRLGGLLGRKRVEQEMDEEMRFHLEMQTEENIRSGMTVEEARRAAAKAFGAVTKVKEACREQKGLPTAESIVQDLKYGMRKLVGMPLFTGAALLTLALGIGANTAVFTVMDAVLLRPLPFPDPDRLVLVWENDVLRNSEMETASFPDFLDIQQQASSFEALAAYERNNRTLTGRGEPERLAAARVTADYFRLMGTRPILGRSFLPQEFTAGQQAPVIVGYGVWQRKFGGDPAAIGAPMILDGIHHTVVGIMPRELSEALVPFQTEELWLPLVPGHDDLIRGRHNVRLYGRLKPGVEPKAARTELSEIMKRLEKAYPDDNKGRGAHLVSLDDQLVGESRHTLHVLQAAVGLVLLIGCLNLANLLMARLSARRGEIAVRTALGAGRFRVVRQLLTETLLLSVWGGLLGLVVAFVVVRGFAALGPEILPRLAGIQVDARVVAFLTLVLLGTAALFGMIPALAVSGEPVHEAVKTSGRNLTENRRNRIVREILVAGQVALALVLLVSAGLLLKSFWRLTATNPGYEPRGLLQVTLELPQGRYPYPKTWPIIGWPAVTNLTDRVVGEAGRLPGVSSASISLHDPLTGGWTTRVTVVGRPAPPPGEQDEAEFSPVDQEYFRTLRVPLKKGRQFTEMDDAKHPLVAIVNEAFLRRHFPDEDPVGRSINVFGVPRQIIGVSGDVRLAGFTDPPRPVVYLPFRQNPMARFSVLVRTEGDATQLVPAVRKLINSIDRDLAVYNVTTLDQGLDDSLAARRLTAVVVAGMAGIALFLAALGIYGVISYSVSQRTSEIGIRIAVGARGFDIVRREVSVMMMRVLAGLLLGCAGALVSGRFLSSLLHDVSPTDPAVFSLVLIMLVLVGLAACFLPVMRAIRLDPVAALRQE